MGNFHDSWRDFDPSKRREAPTPFGGKTVAGVDPAVAAAKKKLDRGSQRGARKCIVDGTMLYEYDVAKAQGIKGIYFQSIKEAKRWISLVEMERAGTVRFLRRQVEFSLQARRPDGLMEHIAKYRADFVYERFVSDRWEEIVEDVKPGFAGRKDAFREEVYLLKRKWFQAQYGRPILET